MSFGLTGKKGQVAIFVIIALVVVAGIVTFFVFRGGILGSEVPAELKPVYDYYISCVEEESRIAIDLAGTQAGYVNTPDYIPGTEYAPFASQLNFMGFGVPYWYYISGSGVVKESVPSKEDIQNDMAAYITANVNRNCDFEALSGKGYAIAFGSEPSAEVSISNDKVDVKVESELVASKGGSTASKSTHDVSISSKFGKLYESAKKIYEAQRDGAILENYTQDVLRLYAPVDGVEIGCSPKIWKTREVIDELKNAIEANIAAIKFKGDYYSLQDKRKNYFVVNVPVDEPVNLVYSKSWPTKIQVYGADDELMIAQPIGEQEGMGILGFCSAPYHFVYDISFPVMMQVYEDNEIFQFPVVVVIDKNLPRQGAYYPLPEKSDIPDLCQYKTQEVKVNVYDSDLNSIDANLSYLCFSSQCRLGESKGGVFAGSAPACVNGYLIARAEGYSEKRQLFSTNEEWTSDMILDREYNVDLALEAGGKPLEGLAVVSFTGERSASTALPAVSKIKLSEGLYNVSVFVYGNSSIAIPASTKSQCVTAGKGGIAGFFGATEEKCFEVNVPETKIEAALLGGGKGEIYLMRSDLEKGRITLKVDALPKPNSLEDLAKNYEQFDDMGVELEL
jgi:hypothetical protein